ncbi:MAG TPA: hypothetical protein VGN34_34040 [Ktedonobacteraceae bacterium]
MSAVKQIETASVEQNYSRWLRRLLAVPPSFFAIPFGVVGLARVWQVAGSLYGFPLQIGNALYLLTALVFLLLLAIAVVKLVCAPKILVSNLTDSIQGPFNSLLPVSGMLLAVGLQPYAYRVALVLCLVFFAATILLCGWMIGHWIATNALETDQFHSGYFLPTVAGSFLCGDSAARFGFIGLGWLGFGIGIVCWLMLGSVTFNRLFFRPRLPDALLPTIAIELAPPVVGGSAYFRLAGTRPDIFAYILAGYAILIVISQLRLLPLYCKLSFTPGFWSFTFPWAAAAGYALLWLSLTNMAGRSVLVDIVLTVITVLIGGIGIRSLAALFQGKFLPAEQTLLSHSTIDNTR